MNESKLNKILFFAVFPVQVIYFIVLLITNIVGLITKETSLFIVIFVLAITFVPVYFSLWTIRNKTEYDDYKAMVGMFIFSLGPIMLIIRWIMMLLFETDFSNELSTLFYPFIFPFIVYAFIFIKEKIIEYKIKNK